MRGDLHDEWNEIYMSDPIRAHSTVYSWAPGMGRLPEVEDPGSYYPEGIIRMLDLYNY